MYNPWEYMIDFGKYKPQDGEQKHFKNWHIFLNYNFNNRTECFIPFEWQEHRTNPAYIHSDHKVHLFFSKPHECLVGGGLRRFVEEYTSTDRDHKLVIHVPKSEPQVKEMIQVGLEGLEYILIFEKNSTVTLFDYEFNGHTKHEQKTYFYVGWLHNQRIATGYYNEEENKKNGNQEHKKEGQHDSHGPESDLDKPGQG